MLNKIFTALSGVAPIPASDFQRLKLLRLIVRFRLERDTTSRDFFHSMNCTPEDFSLEELLTWQEGILVKLTEQHLSHMDEFYRSRHGLSKEEFETTHVQLASTHFNATFRDIGAEFPIDTGLKTIQDLIAHFFKHMPEDIPHPFPHHLIPPAVELVKRFYRR